MPEFWAVRCFNCKAFVNQQKKKVKKWKCPICGSKQSVRRIYGTSDRAKNIRQLIVELNKKRAEYDRQEQEAYDGIDKYLQNNITQINEINEQQIQEEATQNKWIQFKSHTDNKNETHNNNNQDVDNQFVLQIPTKITKDIDQIQVINDNYYEPERKKRKLNIKKEKDDEWNWDIWHKNEKPDNNDSNGDNYKCEPAQTQIFPSQNITLSAAATSQFETEKIELSTTTKFVSQNINNLNKNVSESDEEFIATQSDTNILIGVDLDENKNNIEIALQSQHEMDKSNIYQTEKYIGAHAEKSCKWSDFL